MLSMSNAERLAVLLSAMSQGDREAMQAPGCNGLFSLQGAEIVGSLDQNSSDALSVAARMVEARQWVADVHASPVVARMVAAGALKAIERLARLDEALTILETTYAENLSKAHGPRSFVSASRDYFAGRGF